MKMVTTILIESEVSEEEYQEYLEAKKECAVNNPEWEDDGRIERETIERGLRDTDFVHKKDVILVGFHFE